MNRVYFLCIVLAACAISAADAPISAIAEIRLAAEKGDTQAEYELAKDHFFRLEYATAAHWWRKAAHKGHAKAQTELGRLLVDGKNALKPSQSVKASPAEGARWLLAASEQRDRDAMIAFARCHEHGLGVRKDILEAYVWLNLACEDSKIHQRLYLDTLVRRMTVAQIKAAEERWNAIRNPNAQDAKRDFWEGISLKGISTFKDRRQAAINEVLVSEGDEFFVRLPNRAVLLRCLSIGERSVVLTNTSQRLGKEFVLPRKEP